jgi:hypothetical protein
MNMDMDIDMIIPVPIIRELKRLLSLIERERCLVKKNQQNYIKISLN